MTTPTIDPLADDPVLVHRLEEEVVSLSSASPASPIMTPSTSSDRPADSAQHSLSAEMLTTLLDRTADACRREGRLSEREIFLKHQVSAITKREDDLDKRERELRFQKLPPLDKLQLALEQLESTNLMKATQLYSAWQLKQLGQLPEPGDEILASSIVGRPRVASDAEERAQGVADDVFAPCRNCGYKGRILQACPDHIGFHGPVRTKTSESTDRLKRVEDKPQQLLSQAAGEEKNLSHENKNSEAFVALPKQIHHVAPKASFDGRMHDKANFTSSAFAFSRAPGFDGRGGHFSGSNYGVSVLREGKPNPLRGERFPYVESNLLKQHIQVATIDPSKEVGPAAFNRTVSLNDTKHEPSWSESFTNTSASTSKTATVPPTPKRNWPLPTKGPDLKAPTSFSNTFKVPDVTDEDSDNELKDERKDGRISRFFRPSSPQVGSKHDAPNTFANRRPDRIHFEDPLSKAAEQVKEWNAKDNSRPKSKFTPEELRNLMYRDSC